MYFCIEIKLQSNLFILMTTKVKNKSMQNNRWLSYYC